MLLRHWAVCSRYPARYCKLPYDFIWLYAQRLYEALLNWKKINKAEQISTEPPAKVARNERVQKEY